MSKGGTHPQLTWYQHWHRLWKGNKNVNNLKKLIVSSSGPPRSRQPRSQRKNSRQNEEVTYLGNAEFSSNEPERQPEKRSPPTCYALQDESSDSIHISTKRRRNKKSQLSNAMCTRLRP
ncbi:hypothetical protein CK203_069718 [Vitis vinifera]|uniref:Uncharacterized protein n=1 Tax=Vitis vinifera TaxID=29760 RepID=A0A438E007_VITVI|nr:hypothetical protein CK203_069718 [Vitis vinifera]